MRISLHRPFILRRIDSDRYARSRIACFESALRDFEVRQAYRRTQTKEVLRMVGNAYREFQTAMISGIYLVLDPNGKYANAMHIILDGFLKDHEGEAFDLLDETTRREIKIVELLKSKALQAESKGRSMTIDTSMANDRSMDAPNLLLSLQQSQGSQMKHGRSASESASPGIRQTFPMLPAKGNIVSNASTPTSVLGRLTTLPQSPTFHRIQAQSGTTPNAQLSPAGSGSPGADEDMSAQNMLDHWCNVVTNPPPPLLDSFAGNGNSLSSGQWGTFTTGVGSNTAAVADWLNTPYLINGEAVMNGNGLEGADYNYWENLVNTIRGAPA